MANCAYRITKDGSNYGIAINVADTTSATNLTTNYGGYNLYVNGSANITSNLNVGGTISGNSFTPTSPVAIEYGGTGASTAASARINLGLGSAATRADSYFALSGHNHDTVYKKIQTAVNNPTASGNTITYVDTISQNTQGVITATRKTIPNASTTTTGLVTTGEQTFSGAKSFANSISFTSGYIFYDIRISDIFVVANSPTSTFSEIVFG